MLGDHPLLQPGLEQPLGRQGLVVFPFGALPDGVDRNIAHRFESHRVAQGVLVEGGVEMRVELPGEDEARAQGTERVHVAR